MGNIDDKILTLVKMTNPNNPLEYTHNIVKEYALEKEIQAIKSCENCDICHRCIKSIPYGNTKSKILLVGESISTEQYEKGNRVDLALNDSDGETLKRALGVLNINIEELFITNAVCCYPSKERNGAMVKKIPSVKERTECRKHLNGIIDILKPDVVITLGSVATNSLSSEKLSIMECRGKSFLYKGIYVVPTFHPGFFREMADTLDEEIMIAYKDNFLEDLYNAFNYIKETNKEDKTVQNLISPFEQ